MFSTPQWILYIIAKERTDTQDRSYYQEPENLSKTETSHLAVHPARWLADDRSDSFSDLVGHPSVNAITRTFKFPLSALHFTFCVGRSSYLPQ
ncbi:MAG: hypothetical protein ACI4PO_08990, partial [Faecousia sp.]